MLLDLDDWLHHRYDPIQAIKKNIRKDWDHFALTTNPAVPWKDISGNMDLNWNYEDLHLRDDFDVAILDEHPTVRWNWNGIKEKFGLSVWDYVWRYRELGWNWKGLTRYHQDGVDWDILRGFSTMNWDWNLMMRYVKPEEYEALYELMPDRERPLFCTIATFDMAFFRNHPHLPWDFKWLSGKRYLDWSLLVSLRSRPWDWKLLSKHRDLDWKFFEKHHDMPWDWKVLSSQNDVPWWLIVAIRFCDWDWKLLSQADNLNWYAVVLLRDEDWNWNTLSRREDIRPCVLPLLSKYWNYRTLSRNRSVPVSVREKYWYLPWHGLTLQKRTIAVGIIEHWWASNPHTLCCKNRLMREFEELRQDDEKI